MKVFSGGGTLGAAVQLLEIYFQLSGVRVCVDNAPIVGEDHRYMDLDRKKRNGCDLDRIEKGKVSKKENGVLDSFSSVR
jgi:hypothetical protein